MTKQELPKEYLNWIDEERNIAENLYNQHKSTVGKGLVPFLPRQTTNRNLIVRLTAAAVLVLALGVSVWMKRDDIFKPNYSEEQIALSYDQTLRALAVCANSLKTEMTHLKNVNQIPESIDNLKKLKTVINN